MNDSGTRKIGDVIQRAMRHANDARTTDARSAAEERRQAKLRDLEDSEKTKERIRDAHNRMRGVAPGTPTDETPEVIEMFSDRPALLEEGQSDCPVCKNMRYVAGKSGGLVQCPKCQVAQKWARESLKGFASMSANMAGQTFENFNASWYAEQSEKGAASKERLEEMSRAFRAFADSPKGWLIAIGRKGCGKTHLCSAVVNQMIGNGKQVIFVTAPELLMSLQAAFKAKEEEESAAERLQRYMKAPVLILDDIGQEQVSDWSIGVWDKIIDHRYENSLPTIFTSNFNITADGTKFLSSRAIDRLNDVRMVTVVIVPTAMLPSYRRGAVSNQEMTEF